MKVVLSDVHLAYDLNLSRLQRLEDHRASVNGVSGEFERNVLNFLPQKKNIVFY
jgi:hypothetical protein